MMQLALTKIRHLLGERAALRWITPFARIADMRGADRVFSRIASGPDRGPIEDYLAEIRYALVFAGLGFAVEVEPLGRKGPDLKVTRDAHEAVVEVTRFREVYPGPPTSDLLDERPILTEYGNPPRDIKKAFQKMIAKLPQLGSGHSILAIWNDDEDLEELEVGEAVADLRDDAGQGLVAVPPGLLFVLYGSAWVRRAKQLHCFPVRKLDQPYQTCWQREIECSTVAELINAALTQGSERDARPT